MKRWGLSLLLIIVVAWCGWAVSPRYHLPSDLKGTACSALLDSRLASVTRDQSYYRTDAGLENLRRHKRLGTEFDALIGSKFEELDFYWTKLRLSSLFLVGGPSSRHRDFVIIVNRKESDQVWSITNFDEDFIAFLEDLNFVVKDASDARHLCTLWFLVVPRPVWDFDVAATRDGWMCSHVDHGSAVHTLFSLNDEGLVSSIEQLKANR